MSTLDLYALDFVNPRRGISTPALLVTLSIAMLLAVAAIDLAQLSHQRQQIQIGADAATLAATPQLMDQRWLYLGPEDSSNPDLETMLVNIQLTQIDAAQRQAILYAGLNNVANRPIILEKNPNNALSGDVVVGFVAEPATDGFTAAPGPEGGFNSMIVRASRRKAAGELPLLWMARQVGLEKLDMKVYSQAVVDQRINGFRPLAHVPVPMLPLAVMPTLEDLQMHTGANIPPHLWWAKGPHDRYTVNPLAQTVAARPDGIAEMVIRIHSDGGGTPSHQVKTRRGAIVGFGEDGNTSPAAFRHFSLFGLTRNDLPGQQLAIADVQHPPMFPAEYNDDERDLIAIRDALLRTDRQLFGAPRLLPIGVKVGPAEVGIVGFVAGTVVHCHQDPGDDSLLIVVQPCLLQTPTALAGGDTPRNPWIGKLLLNR